MAKRGTRMVEGSERIETVKYGRGTMDRRMAREDLGPVRAPQLTEQALALFSELGFEVVSSPRGLRLAGGWHDIGPGF